jgi:transposase
MSKIDRTPPGGGGRDWATYNASQDNEKSNFLRISHELSKDVEEPEAGLGRKPFRLAVMVFCLAFKVYSMMSARRFRDDLREAQAKGFIEAAPSATSISEYMRSESLSITLQHLIVKSSLPLAEVETVFAVDSTGFSLPKKRKWFNKHTNRHEKRRDYMKLHVMIGVKSNIITYAEPTVGSASDMVYLKHLVEGTSRYFEISEVSADAGYLSGENMYAVLLKGGIPYIAFKKNCALDADYKSTFWKDMLYLHKTRHPVFTEHYFLRNNVEAAFHSMKAKFGGRLRSKSTRGQFNEALTKALCHNICMLIRSSHELGINPISWSEKTPKPLFEGASIVEAMAHRKEELLEIREAAGDREMPPKQEERKPSQKAKAHKDANHASGQISLFE